MWIVQCQRLTVICVAFQRDMYVGTGTRCALRLLFTISTTWHLRLQYDRKCYITLTKWIYPQIWEGCRPADANPVLFQFWPTVCNNDPTLVGNHIQCYPNIETISGNRLVFAGKLTVHCAGHPRVHQARLLTDVWRNQRSCLLLVLLKNFEYICHSISHIHAINPLTAKLFNLNFHPLEVVSRWRDPQLQMSENYSDLTKWRSTLFKSCWLMSHFIFKMFKMWYLMCW